MNIIDIKTRIESQDKSHQIEILRILLKNKVQINENNNGIFVNLTKLDSSIIEELIKYLNYINEQNTTLDDIEQKKENYKLNFFNNKNDNKSIEFKDKNVELI
ncbi:MAG: hypothetical protein CMF80_05980 [Candidatus Marinimicrobia bacterium]|nr:hypothetical protein [Candidatus Neomarinimicrobiota bacterium]|tara:strand:+ start:2396 stop:2704 length:309 start_codon:yes stop_codon:yes gene_type:complete